MIPEASAFLVRAFTVLCVVTAAALPIGVYVASRRSGAASLAARRALWTLVGAAVWMGATYAAAASGALTFGPMPPPIAFVILPMMIGAVVLGRSEIGRVLATGLPLAALVGFHAFRLPLELLMHRAYAEGVMPVQMSYSGLNFDILTGASAIVAGLLIALGRMPTWGVRLWNWIGSALLLNIVTIALLSTPTPIRLFDTEPANVWITRAPFVWLPAVMVFCALLGHMLVYRRLRLGGVGSGSDAREEASHRSLETA